MTFVLEEREDAPALRLVTSITDPMWEAADRVTTDHFRAVFAEWCVVLMKWKARGNRSDRRPLTGHELLRVAPGFDADVRLFAERLNEAIEALAAYPSAKAWHHALDSMGFAPRHGEVAPC